MIPIRPARLMEGIRPESISAGDPGSGGGEAASRTVRGRALIVWDPKRPDQKLDAIDTDQITPAADCVSESLETLDERWKAGSFFVCALGDIRLWADCAVRLTRLSFVRSERASVPLNL